VVDVPDQEQPAEHPISAYRVLVSNPIDIAILASPIDIGIVPVANKFPIHRENNSRSLHITPTDFYNASNPSSISNPLSRSNTASQYGCQRIRQGAQGAGANSLHKQRGTLPLRTSSQFAKPQLML
jgi:hypothetical protein